MLKFLPLAAVVLLLGVSALAGSEDTSDLDSYIEQLSPESQKYFASLDVEDDNSIRSSSSSEDQARDDDEKHRCRRHHGGSSGRFVNVVNVIDSLRDKLIKERSELLAHQHQEHKELHLAEKNKARICRSSGTQKSLVEKAEKEERLLSDKMGKDKREMLVASSLRSKNLQLNSALRRSFESEEKLLHSLNDMITRLHGLKGSKHSSSREGVARDIKDLLSLLETPTAQEKAQMTALDISRVHGESLTLRSMIEKMLADIKAQSETMVKQEEQDKSEVERLSKRSESIKEQHHKAALAHRKVEDRYHELLRNCEGASGRYAESAKLALKHSKVALQRQGVISRELKTLGEMRHHIAEKLSETQKYDLTKLELKHAYAAAAADAKGLSDADAREQEREKQALLMEQKEAQQAVSKEEAERKKRAAESEEALKEAKKKEQEAVAHAKEAEKAANEALLHSKIETDRKQKREMELAQKRARVAKERLERKRKIAVCIDMTRSVTEELMGSPSAPAFAIKQCSEMGGDATALRAGLQRLIRGTAAFNDRRCNHTVKRLFTKLLRREPEPRELESYLKGCMHGDSDKALSKRIKGTKEYKLRVKTPHVARKCLAAVVDTWTEVFGSKPSGTNSVFWAKKCVRGMTTTEIAAELRKLPEYEVLASRKKEEAEIERLKADAKKAA